MLDSEGCLRDLSHWVADFNPDTVSPQLLDRLAALDAASLPLVDAGARLGPPVSRPSKIVGIGLNYRRHANEAGLALPGEPVLFLKAPSALSGPDDDIVLPPDAHAVDWEVELGVIISRCASNIPESKAGDHVAGYLVANDVSERDFQLHRQGQWTKGKSADSFAPIGPWLVTADEVPDPQDLALWLDLNGERLQASSTADMVFGIHEIISYISRFMSLQPGDVIMTGTPAGVGAGFNPPRYLRPGDLLECGVQGLGVQRHRAEAWPGAPDGSPSEAAPT
jgi:2,4-diketo-3-deoxy-L-fuconate hydrolase